MENKQVDRLGSILAKYFTNGSWVVEEKESGINNTTRYVQAEGKTFVLRIYENHAEPEKVAFEHAVLEALGKAELNFGIPQPYPSEEGGTWVTADDGKLAVLFRYMEGERANLEEPGMAASAGETVGRLVGALSGVEIAAPPAYEPYYDIYHVHPLVTRERLGEWLEEMSGRGFSAEADQVRTALQELERDLPELQGQLPVQLVHSDIVYGNMLASGGRISAVLDFEFVTPDWRAMELAVLLSELFPPESLDPAVPEAEERCWRAAEQALKGYGRAAALTAAEIAALPRLMLLRRLVLVPHFLGRYLAGVEGEERALHYLTSFAKVSRLIGEQGPRLGAIAERYIRKE
ncbi:MULTISPECIES: phosphotransferase [Paenibacillus]|uniref:phosphotransferase n=1 Tax=Paenibacillus TaxID=44249 RepID=UPI0022B910FC|nr:phosphotransferase [Paenibacillus caseinilyticus]MCZ8518911.1 phosphotransferase [Paenibacillus caseinilyticus]